MAINFTDNTFRTTLPTHHANKPTLDDLGNAGGKLQYDSNDVFPLTNESILELLSESGGKLQYNSSDVFPLTNESVLSLLSNAAGKLAFNGSAVDTANIESSIDAVNGYGWIKVGGIQLVWGKILNVPTADFSISPYYGSTTVTFSQNFTTKVHGVFITGDNNSNTTTRRGHVSSLTTTSFKIYNHEIGPGTFYWLAIGV